MASVTPSPISLTILRRGETNIIDLADVGALIPRSETHVDETFLQELMAEMQRLATPGSHQRSGQGGQATSAVPEPDAMSATLQRLGGLIFWYCSPGNAMPRAPRVKAVLIR